MILKSKINLIDRDELIEQLVREDVSTREKIVDIVCRQQVIAVAKPKLEIEFC